MKKQLFLGLLVVGMVPGVSTIQAKCHIVSTSIFYSSYHKAKNVCGTCSPAGYDEMGNIRCWCCNIQELETVVNGFINDNTDKINH